MKFLLSSLNLEYNPCVKNWYEGFPPKTSSSLRQLIDAFSKDWDYNMDEHVRKVMSNHMWEEILRNILKQDFPNEEINEDTPFELKDPDNPTDLEMKIVFTPLNFSNILGH